MCDPPFLPPAQRSVETGAAPAGGGSRSVTVGAAGVRVPLKGCHTGRFTSGAS